MPAMAIVSGVGPIKTEPVAYALADKGFVFRQKAVSGVDGLGVCVFGSLDDIFHSKVALAAQGRPDIDGFVSEFDVQGICIGIRINGNTRDVHFPAGPDNSQSDFTTVCN